MELTLKTADSSTSNKDEMIRADIILAARDLFQRFGLLKTTMEDIAKAAGKAKSSLYYYYCSKDDIFEAVIHEDMRHVLGQVEEAVKNERTAELKLKAFALTRLKIFEERITLFKIVIGELKDNPGLVKKNKKAYEAHEMALLRSILLSGVKTGEFRKMHKEDIDNLAFVMLMAIRGIERTMMVSDSVMKNIDDRMKVILDILANGIKSKTVK